MKAVRTKFTILIGLIKLPRVHYYYPFNIERVCLENIVISSEEFVSTFSEQIQQLIPHDFIAKKQSEHLRLCKEMLQRGEYVVVSDFSQNYTFVIQV